MALWDLFTGSAGRAGRSVRRAAEDAAKLKPPLLAPDFTDQIIQAVMRQEALRLQTGRTRQAAFGQQYLYGGTFPTLLRGW